MPSSESPQDSSWSTAVSATLHCLTGCALGEIAGMILSTWWGWGNAASVVLSMLLAFVFGYSLTFSSVRRHVDTGEAVRLALASDTVSILAMEVIDNVLMVAWPGAMSAGLGDVLFWVSLAVSLAIAFSFTVPVNRELIRRGKGHAVVHSMHGH